MTVAVVFFGQLTLSLKTYKHRLIHSSRNGGAPRIPLCGFCC
jgi:hypothetical protein